MPYISNPHKFEEAKLHLDRFWEEIFWRRENEQKIAVWSIGLFTALLTFVYGADVKLEFPQGIIISVLTSILGLLSAWYLYQNWRKDKEIAYLIVKLNEALGAWENGYFISGVPLYPEKWKNWGIDPGLERKRFRKRFVKDSVLVQREMDFVV